MLFNYETFTYYPIIILEILTEPTTPIFISGHFFYYMESHTHNHRQDGSLLTFCYYVICECFLIKTLLWYINLFLCSKEKCADIITKNITKQFLWFKCNLQGYFSSHHHQKWPCFYILHEVCILFPLFYSISRKLLSCTVHTTQGLMNQGLLSKTMNNARFTLEFLVQFDSISSGLIFAYCPTQYYKYFNSYTSIYLLKTKV